MIITKQQHDRNSVQISLIAGSCSGILSTMTLYPMDVLRTKMQTGIGSPIYVFRQTMVHGGIRALYTGMALPLAAQTVYKGTVFTVNNMTQNYILDYRAHTYHNRDHTLTSASHLLQLTALDRFVSGFIGGAVNGALFVTPVELVRNQLIAQHSKLASMTVDSTSPQQYNIRKQFHGSWDVIRYAMKKQGIHSLWRGIGWTICRDGIGCGFFFYSLAWFQQQLTPRGESASLPVQIISGGLAGAIFWSVALPMDTIKTWVQSSDLNVSVVSVKRSIHTIYQENGGLGVVRTLFRGWQVAFGKSIPSSALIVVTYSFVYDGLYQSDVVVP